MATFKQRWSVGDSKTLVGVFYDNFLGGGRLGFLLDPLLGFIDEGLIVSKIGEDVFGKVVLDHCEIGNNRVYLLRSCLLAHDPELVLVLILRFSLLAERIRLLSYVQFGGLSLAGLVREHLPPLELLLQAVLVKFFQLLYVLHDVVIRLDIGLGRLLLLNWLFLRRRSSRVGQIVKALWFLLVALQLELPLYDLFEVLGIFIVLSSLIWVGGDVPSSIFLRFSSYIFFWHCLIFLSISFIYVLGSTELFLRRAWLWDL